MPEKIEINGRKFFKRTLEVLSGVKNFVEVDENLLLVAEAIDNPYDFPFLLEDIYDMDIDEDLRLALARIQIDSKLHMRSDLEKEQLRLYVSETIEKMLFGELLMDGNGHGREKDDEEKKDKDKKEKTKSKSNGKGKGKGKGKAKSTGKGRGGKGKSKGEDKEKEENNNSGDEPDNKHDITYV